MKTRIIKKPNKIFSLLKKLESGMEKGGDKVLVGLPKDSNPYPNGTSVILVGLIHEFGSPARGIPQRSYLRSTVKAKKSEYKEMIKAQAKKIVAGKLDKTTALKQIGLKVQGDVVERIQSGIAPPLKHRKGTALWDTGHLVQSISYQVTE